MELKQILIMFILFGMFVVASSAIVADMSQTYSTAYDGNWSGTYNKINNITTDLNTAQTNLQASGSSPVSFFDYILTGAWQSVKLTINSGSLAKSMAEDMGNRYNIPPIFIGGFLAILTATIIFAILTLVFKVKT